MKKILIFTNQHSFENNIDLSDICGINETFNNYPTEDRPVVLCKINEGAPVTLNAVTDCSSDGIYLVFDEMEQETFDLLMSQCKPEDSFILVHSSGRTEPEIPEALKGCCYSGRHENDTKYVYRPVFCILADSEGDKMKRISDLLKPLRKDQFKIAIKTFLMECMTLGNTSTKFENAIEQLTKGARSKDSKDIVQKFLEEIYRKQNGDKLEKAYLDEVIKLRDELHKLAGIAG